MYDDEDDELTVNKPGADALYSSEELCQYVFETLEKKHPIKISEIEYAFGGFEFAVSADLTKEMPIPNCWQLRSFGDGKLNFFLTLEDFQMLYNKLEKRDFADAVRAALERMYGKVCTIVSIKDAEHPVYDGAVDVVVSLHTGCRFEPWFQIQWIEGDLISFQIDESIYYDMVQSDDYRNFLN